MTFPCLVRRLNLEQRLFYRLLHKKKEDPCAAYRKVSYVDATLPVCPSLKFMYLSNLVAVSAAGCCVPRNLTTSSFRGRETNFFGSKFAIDSSTLLSKRLLLLYLMASNRRHLPGYEDDTGTFCRLGIPGAGRALWPPSLWRCAVLPWKHQRSHEADRSRLERSVRFSSCRCKLRFSEQ